MSPLEKQSWLVSFRRVNIEELVEIQLILEAVMAEKEAQLM